MANPNVPQGTLNRIRASVVFPDNENLNVTSSFLGKEGVRLAFEGNATTYIDTLVGAVTSPEPYIKVTVTIHLLKTQPLAAQYKSAMENLSTIGALTVRADAATLPPYSFINGSIQSVRDLDFSGADAGYMVTIGAYYPINQSLFA